MCYGNHIIYEHNCSRFSRMSIPPLVCNTPPPPDQCEDDRDTDFDIQYNLSQEDEDTNNYDFGAYSDYIYPSTTSANLQGCKWSPDISKNTEGKLADELFSENENHDSTNILPDTNSSDIHKLRLDDIIIEDLNLKVENQNDVVSGEQSINKCTVEGSSIDSTVKDIEMAIEVITIDTINVSKIDETHDDSSDGVSDNIIVNDIYKDVNDVMTGDLSEPNVNNDEKPYHEEGLSDIEETVAMQEQLEAVKNIERENITDPYNLEEVCDNDIVEGEKIVTDELENKLESIRDSEFDDFEGFQFTSSDNDPPVTIEECDNPWDGEVSENNDFGDFKANFDNKGDSLDTPSDNFDINKPATDKENTDDDFGDFDDFQSSSTEHKVETLNENIPAQHVPVFSLSSPESEGQVIGSINNVLSSIFTSEITESEKDFEIKLESLHNETWGHLVDTDIRQPYIVNWNNSLGQKSLLKALCIDSRNILFGPKWHNGMPKYAANLSVAPLQPQKPFITSNTTNTENQNTENASSKEPATWTDPFTSDGQESCNTDNGTSAAVTRPANLDVFTNTAPSDDKIYSTTLGVQPIRQINLPDTHIFTPTDSETPRSKTIHYDNGPTVLVPEQPDNNTTPDVAVVQEKSSETENSLANDDDYWEFQDFQGTINSNKTVINSEPPVNEKCEELTSVSNIQPPISVNYQTQILQPIKVEPIMPTLNWPDPGHVKETFEDFTDFISSTTWDNENINTVNPCDNQVTQVTKKIEDESAPKTQHLDDEFETFQSAPVSKPKQESLTENVSAKTIQNFTDNNDISDTVHSKIDSTVRFDDSLQHNQRTLLTSSNFSSHVSLPSSNNFPNLKETNFKTSPELSSRNQINNATLLQPSIASTSGTQRSQQKTGQILQPLSLESYSQINWPNPGIDLQDLSRFNPVESLQSLKSDANVGAQGKLTSPAHKEVNVVRNEVSDEDIWGDFVSSKPKQQQQQSLPKKSPPGFADDDEWTDFVSSPSVKPQNGLNTISLNVHTNLNLHKSAAQNKFPPNGNQISLDIPTLNYITPKSSSRGLYNDKHFQNL